MLQITYMSTLTLVLSFALILVLAIVYVKYLIDNNWKSKINLQYIDRQIHIQLEQQFNTINQLLDEERNLHNATRSDLATKLQEIRGLEDKMEFRVKELQRMKEESRMDFENLANRILEEKSEKFTLQNKIQMEVVLNPLKEKISDFQSNLQNQINEESKSRVALKEQIEMLRVLNQRISLEANQLASAIKGDKKMQGDWGEVQLDMILQRSGLENGVHYTSQHSSKDDSGNQKRPDFVIYLPDGKCLIIDSKVSMNAYEKYYHEEDENERALHLKMHISNLRNHIKSLSGKGYESLPNLKSPEYVLMFIPLEPAFSVALREDSKLFMDALDNNIVMVTTSTLIATMRTVYHIWRQEKQNQNAALIAKESGLLYDKFVGFVEDLKKVGSKLDDADRSYKDAMGKLTDSTRKGDTVIGRVERIKKLGAKTNKSIPLDLLAQIEEDVEEEVGILDERHIEDKVGSGEMEGN